MTNGYYVFDTALIDCIKMFQDVVSYQLFAGGKIPFRSHIFQNIHKTLLIYGIRMKPSFVYEHIAATHVSM